jgi:hypothetical protein
VALTRQPRKAGATDAAAARAGERMAKDLRAAGVARVRIVTLPLRPVAAACVLGARP